MAANRARSVTAMLRWLRDIGIVAILYAVFAALGIAMNIPPDYRYGVWPAAGLSLAILLHRGYALAPGIWCGNMLAVYTVLVHHAPFSYAVRDLLLAAALSLFVTLQSVVGKVLVELAIRGRSWYFWRLQPLLAIVLLGGVVACVVSASCGTLLLYLTDQLEPGQWQRLWFSRWSADFLGVLLFCPLCLVLMQSQATVSWRRKLQIALPLVLLIGISVFVYKSAEQKEIRHLHKRLVFEVEEIAGKVQNDLDTFQHILNALQAFYLSSEQVDREEFAVFSQRLMALSQHVQALQWAPRVEQARRTAFVQRQRDEIGRAFQIKVNRDGAFDRRGEAPFYYPVTYIAPAAGNEGALGFDLYASAPGRRAIDRARNTGQYIATAPVPLEQGGRATLSLSLFKVVSAQQPDVLVGFFQIPTIFSHYISHLHAFELVARVVDVSTGQVLFDWPVQHNPQPGEGRAELPAIDGAFSNDWRHHLVRVEVGQRDWDIAVHLDYGYASDYLYTRVWSLMAGSLGLSGVLGLFVIALTGVAAATEHTVATRTQELAEERNFLDQIFNHLPMIAFVKDPEHFLYLRVNRRFEEYHGLDHRSVHGKSDRDIFPRSWVDAFEATDRQARRSDGGAVMQELQLEGEHETVWFRMHKLPIKGIDGQVHSILGLAENITEQREQESAFSLLVENLPTALLVSDQQGQVVYHNPAAATLFEIQRDGISIQDLIPQGQRALHREFIERYVSAPDLALMDVGRDLQAQSLSGKPLSLEILLVPISWKGAGSILVLAQDVGERKAAEAALRASEERMRFLLANLGEGVYGIDAEGATTFINPAAEKMLGYKEWELTGQVAHTVVHHHRPDGSEYPIEQCPIYAAVAAGTTRRVDDEVFWHKNGSAFPVEYVATPVKDEHGSIQGAVVVFRDITERKALEAELLRSNDELDSFAYIVSHDLKEPLRGIGNYARYLQEDYGKVLQGDGARMLERLVELTAHMEVLISELLEYSRLGRTELAMEPVDLNEVALDVIDSLQPRMQELAVQCEIETPLPVVFCDRVRIRELYRNLITNAMKYNDKPHKHIALGVASDSGENSAEVTLYVKDNGIGIAPDALDKVFSIFQRLHRPDAYGGGTGVGLTIVKKIVDRHHGRIRVNSSVGEGTTFYFTLAGDGPRRQADGGDNG